MKRKITSLIALVLTALATPAFAQILTLTGTGEVVTAPEEGKYYVIQGNAQHDNIITWLFDNNGNLGATAGAEPTGGQEGMKYVWTFERSNDGVAAKNVVTNRYIYIEGTSNNGAVKMRTEPFYFTIDVNGEEVGFKNSAGRYIDMGWSGTNPVTWDGGVSGSRRMSIFIANVENISELEDARYRLNTCFGVYSDYLPGYGGLTIDRGTDLGQYNCSDEVYNTFVNNLQQALDILSEEVLPEGLTVEGINAIIENIETSYAAIMASIVLPDGNYRIVSALQWTKTSNVDTGQVDEDGNPITQQVTTHPIKAMYATLPYVSQEGDSIAGKAMWADIDSTDCRYLWQFTPNPETGYVKLMNIATDGILATCTQSKQATLLPESPTQLAITYIGKNDDGKMVLAMKPSTGGDNAFLHCNEHGGGAGNASNIVGWAASAGASQWILEPVSDEDVAALVEAYAPIKDHELLVSMFQGLIAETEAAINQAKDEQYITQRSEGLITDTLQFSSPYTDPTEGNFSNVLSDDANTYWHSTWQGGNVPAHTHYFQVAFTEPINGNIQCFMRRRGDADNDHITSLSVYGTNDQSILEATTEDGWTNLGSYDLSKNASRGLTVYSNALDFGEGYQYLRFYIDGSILNRGYGHFATFQLYRLTVDGNTQWSQMGDNAAAIDMALATAKAVDLDEVEMSDYNALKDALDAFLAVLVDPSALAAAIEANKDIVSLVAFGENPGFWSEGSEVNTLATTLLLATEYLKSGAYTQEQVDAYTETITSGVEDIMAAANPVEEGKWYAIKFDSEANYDAHKWSKADAINEDLGDLFDNYVAPASIETEGEGESQTSILVGKPSLEEVAVGQALRFINEEDIQEMDQIAFRFVSQGDSAFVIQHKSGLYLGGAARSTNLTLGLTPALFNVKAVGYGKVIIEARDLQGNGYFTSPVYLHAQNAGHSLVTWNDAAVSSKSALYIEPVGDFDEGDDVAESVLMNVKSNSFVFMCFPTAFSVSDAEIYAYQGAFAAEMQEGDTLALAHYAFNRIEQAEAGQPVLLVVGDPERFNAAESEEDVEPIGITPLGSSFAVKPLSGGGVHGTYTYEWVKKGTVVVSGGQIAKPGNMLVLADGEEGTDCTRDVAANTGYIVYGENILKNVSDDDFDFIITAAKPTVTGDVNDDGTVDGGDAQQVLNVMSVDGYDAKCDVNRDNVVDGGDYQQILNIMSAQ
ncbi:MAG: hypothetical protein J6W03_06990 [Bacteroidaceae bacterium]|nr:hypothetical protein [Bacteroidaceae bacterium]